MHCGVEVTESSTNKNINITRTNPCVRVCVSVSRVPAVMMKRQSPPATRRAGVATRRAATAVLSAISPAAFG